MKTPTEFLTELGLTELTKQFKNELLSIEEIEGLSGEDLKAISSIKECLGILKLKKYFTLNDAQGRREPESLIEQPSEKRPHRGKFTFFKNPR